MTVNVRFFLLTPLKPRTLGYPPGYKIKARLQSDWCYYLSVQVWRTVAPISSGGDGAPWWLCRSSSLPPPVSGHHPSCHLSIEESSVISTGEKVWDWELDVALRNAGAWTPVVVAKPFVGVTLVCSVGKTWEIKNWKTAPWK